MELAGEHFVLFKTIRLLRHTQLVLFKSTLMVHGEEYVVTMTLDRVKPM